MIGRFVIVATMVCGAGVGYLLGCGLAFVRTAVWVDTYANLMVTKEAASLADAHSVLNTLKSLRYSPCSDSEISAFRELVFHSAYVKDAGRIRGGKIDCSATEGHPARSAETLQQGIRQEDGAIAYRDSASDDGSGSEREILQLGSAFVEIETSPPPNLALAPIHLTMTMQDAVAPQRGAAEKAAGALYRTTDGIGYLGDLLYATRCSAHPFNCITATTSVHATLQGDSNMLAYSAVGGGLAGILIGVVFLFWYNRSPDLAQQLRRAVQHDELHVVYQPVVNLETHEIVGAEALARWADDEGNEVAPDEFVKIAEDRGFVGGITRGVLRRILSDFAETLQTRPGFRISMNVAAADLADPAFLPMLQESLSKAKVSSESLIIEITERSAADSAEAMETIRELRRMGHSIHIDDFGTGHSNLDKLLYLFADTIKIDKAFTGVIGTDSVGAAILPQILKMAKSLNLEVVVEGVETVHQADYFTPGEQKIYVQGWLYGRPMGVNDFMAELAGNRAEAADEAAAAFTTKAGKLRIVGATAA
jgi:sensor c-di-GMP phosphodiesterase-like protein